MDFHSAIMPSYDAITGRLFSQLHGVSCLRQQPRSNDCCPIKDIAVRVFLALALALTTALDALCWVGMTITVYPAYRVGVDHFKNFIAIVGYPCFAVKILIGRDPNIHYNRRFFTPRA